MSAETLTPRNVELPGYWDTVKHFGGKALRWALGIQNPALAQNRAPNKLVSGASGGLVHSIVEAPSISIKESPTASSWQRARNYPGYEVPGPVSRVEAPRVADRHLMGVSTKEQTQTEPLVNMMQGGLVIGPKEASTTLRTIEAPAQVVMGGSESHKEVHTTGHVTGLTQEASSKAAHVSEAPQNNEASSHSV